MLFDLLFAVLELATYMAFVAALCLIGAPFWAAFTIVLLWVLISRAKDRNSSRR